MCMYSPFYYKFSNTVISISLLSESDMLKMSMPKKLSKLASCETFECVKKSAE